MPVRGKVLFQGVPLHHGVIVFVPDADRGTHGALARADIQEDGSYSVDKSESGEALGGWYRVTVASVETEAAGASGGLRTRSLLPDKYRDPELSGLQCELHPGRVNRINFNLE
jgi:hypothetical protein